jgi:L-amino acid N-acyltransferase YncA
MLHTWFRLLLRKTNPIPVNYHCKTNMIQIRPMIPKDWESVLHIYREGIVTGNATFETSAPDSPAWDKVHMANHRFVAEIDGKLAGWIALTPVSSRCVYAGVAEVSVYVGATFQGQKVGSALLERLITDTEADNIWTLQAGVFPENTASIALHEKHGFRQIGYREKVGKMNGVWRNVILLERRSNVAGIN